MGLDIQNVRQSLNVFPRPRPLPLVSVQNLHEYAEIVIRFFDLINIEVSDSEKLRKNTILRMFLFINIYYD